jgi:hypothetical protein
MLTLGKKLDRSYSFRIPFSEGFYDIGIFFHKKSTLLLFKVDPVVLVTKDVLGSKINMYGNLQTSRFCETFINLHNYRSDSLDIINQFDSLKESLSDYVISVFNETITLSKHQIDQDKTLFDTLSLFGFTLDSARDFLFIIAERQNINTKIKKKIVRTSGLQISTSKSLSLLDDFYFSRNLKS